MSNEPDTPERVWVLPPGYCICSVVPRDDGVEFVRAHVDFVFDGMNCCKVCALVRPTEGWTRPCKGAHGLSLRAPAAEALGLFAVFYDGVTRPVAAFVLEQDARRFAGKYSGGESTWEIRHVQVVEDAAPTALPAVTPDNCFYCRNDLSHSVCAAPPAEARARAKEASAKWWPEFDKTICNPQFSHAHTMKGTCQAAFEEGYIARALTEAQPEKD